MQHTTALTENPHEALTRAATFLASDPVRHNLILTLLQARCASGDAGRYWTVHSDEDVIGVVVQSPFGFPATITPMGDEALAAVARAIGSDGVRLPGVNGEAGAAARFAGEWTEVAEVPATPVNGQRIYEMKSLDAPKSVSGTLRQATGTDRSLVVDWFRAFQTEVGADARDDVGSAVDRRLAARQVWLWDDGGAASMAAATAPVEGVVRVQAVYTPAERRRLGYAAATVATLSGRILHEGWRPILYTDLANPTSNGVYRRIGYRAVVECLRYGFG
jgi:GNAT superfamily N-acetyltransferase